MPLSGPLQEMLVKFSDFSRELSLWEGSVRIETTGPIPRAPNLVVLVQGLRICISTNYIGNSDTGPGTTLRATPLHHKTALAVAQGTF